MPLNSDSVIAVMGDAVIAVSQARQQTQTSKSGINCFDLSNHEAEFFIYRRPVQNGADLSRFG
ncbi:hypothetical protein KVG88_04195 [Pseudomonas sp. SWRI74]|uniref:Uncharacterized protein n=1 Tax=Pseudomonas azerbaijanoccidentalis TaxID=2842347 RepID=A0ABS6QJX7_9PSED|nr:hypothetical protein [Pseudomonas azerbaijanoccidentalis]MBV4519251.1 hypothetical protein [Pseudomonas azerbaijanoccidentalis]